MSPPQLTPQNFELQRDAWGRLVLVDAAGSREVGVVPARAFPISDPEHWVSICDAAGHEILMIEALADVPARPRRALQDALAQREFVPVILKIDSATPEEPSHWQVQTNRGQTSFQVSSEEDVRRIEPARASVVDSHGIRYWIPDIRRLDAGSRRLLDHFL
jgi:hypothetical protein